MMRLVISYFSVAVLGLVALSACNSAEWKTAQSSPSAPAQSAASPPTDGVRRVTVTELKDLMDRNEAFVVDVRNEASYNAAHIKGAKLIPEAETLNHINELPRNKMIVTYCS
jgi:3-mercaptopyruvate sulfurtransferase SseA